MIGEHGSATSWLRASVGLALAIGYADATRSSYIAIAFLGALAVLVGLLALLFPEKLLAEAKIAALLIEGFIIGVAGFIF